MLSGGTISEAMELFDLKWTAGTAEQNRAFAALGKYVQGLMERNDVEGFQGLMEAESEETAKKFSIQYDADGNPYVNVDIDQEQFDGLSIEEAQKKAKIILKKRFIGITLSRMQPCAGEGLSIMHIIMVISRMKNVW